MLIFIKLFINCLRKINVSIYLKMSLNTGDEVEADTGCSMGELRVNWSGFGQWPIPSLLLTFIYPKFLVLFILYYYKGKSKFIDSTQVCIICCFEDSNSIYFILAPVILYLKVKTIFVRFYERPI